MSDVLEYKQAHELPRTAKLLFLGDSGSGKTRLACLSPKPVVLLVEPNGLMTIQATNPQAVVVEADSLDKVYAFFKDCFNGRLKELTGCETVVIDSLTEMQRLIKDDIMKQKGATPGAAAKFTLADWGLLTDRMRKMIRTVRDLPFTVVCTALAQYEFDEATGTRHAMPSFEGRKMPNEICGYFSAVGYVFREQVVQDEEVHIQHRVMFRGPSNYMTKSLPGLEAVEEPNVGAILEKIGATGPEGTQDVAPDPKKKKTSPTGRRRRPNNNQVSQ